MSKNKNEITTQQAFDMLKCSCGECGICISKALEQDALMKELDEMHSCDCGNCEYCYERADFETLQKELDEEDEEGCWAFPAHLNYVDTDSSIVVSRQKFLEEYVDGFISRAGGKVVYRQRASENGLAVYARITASKIKGIGIGGLNLSVDTYRKSPLIIRVEGVYQNITSEKASYIEIGRKCLYIVDTIIHDSLQYKYPVRIPVGCGHQFR